MVTGIAQSGEAGLDLQSRAGLYELLSRILLQELDRPTLELFKTPQWQMLFSRLGIDCPDTSEDVLEDLAIDYCQIFIGPKDHCPPYQSVWESGQLESSVLDSMNHFLEFIRPRSDVGINDHFGIQLEMMAFVLLFQDENRDKAGEELARHFFQNHVAWGQRMLAAAASVAKTDFYQQVLSLAEKIVQLEAQYFSAHQTD